MSIVRQLAVTAGTYAIQSLYQYHVNDRPKTKAKSKPGKNKSSLLQGVVENSMNKLLTIDPSNISIKSIATSVLAETILVSTDTLPIITDSIYGEKLLKKCKKIHGKEKITMKKATKYLKQIKKVNKEHRGLVHG